MAVAGTASASAAAPVPPVDMDVLHVQVILDHLGFSPGVLDGRPGQSLTAALEAFQESRGIPETGKIDRQTIWALHPYAHWRPVVRIALTEEMLAGPFVSPFPRDPEAQAKLPAMAYRNAIEKLAERFHTKPQVLVALNSYETRVKVGAVLRFPNAVPDSTDYPASLDPEWRRTLAGLNVEAKVPEAAEVVVDKSEKTLSVYDADGRRVAMFSATMGSEHDPLPIGTWKIQGASYNPKFHYNPQLFWDVSDAKRKLLLPAGPNGPVGVVWLDLSKPHYGIHGTPAPETIGRAESHGCIRLTNWDVARLSLMVKPGTPAIFQE
ncbi:L,D-transpeptidase family protein [Sphingomonas sp.]|uniref:L,D-transpeptidase family protein n=1 Tax=Sphingomonas sp. TaxID=28214 RepID=UPI001B082854|nr:L,D-transpeptidase family protein [Sphingomonas sp.]MBO9712100.1 murein L,D-transpeptidase [Sphingomonas sp.]